MRNVIGSLIVLILTACASQTTVEVSEPPEPTLAPVVRDVIPTPVPEAAPVVEAPAPVVGETIVLDITAEGYQSLLAFVQKHGVPESRNDNDIQYTYWDKAGNRHAIVAIYKPEGVPRDQAAPVQISVWVNTRDAKPGKDHYAYLIFDDGSVEYDCGCVDWLTGEKTGPNYANEVRTAVAEVLELAKTQP